MADFKSRDSKPDSTSLNTTRQSPPLTAASSHKPRQVSAMDFDNLSREDILQLQRTIGNQAVIRLLQRQATPPPEPPPTPPKPVTIHGVSVGHIQRSLIDKAKRAFETASKYNSSYSADMTDAHVKEAQQKVLVALRSGWNAPSPRDEKTLKDLLRAYLLHSYAKVVGRPEDQKSKTDDEYFERAKMEKEKYVNVLSKGFGDTETRKWLESQGFTSAIPDTSQLKTGEPTIDVRATFIGGKVFGQLRRAHLYIIVNFGNGKQYYFRGGPNSSGRTQADYGDYLPSTVDWDPSAPSVTVMTGQKVIEEKFDQLIEAAKAVTAQQVPYTAGLVSDNENCNSTAFTMLTRAGIPTRKPSGQHPGWGHLLGTVSGKGKKIEDKEDFSGPGKIYTAAEKLTVYHDRERLEKASSIAAQQDVTVLYSDEEVHDNRVAPIRYNGDKIGWVLTQHLQPTVDPKQTSAKYQVSTYTYALDQFTEEPTTVELYLEQVVDVIDEAWLKDNDSVENPLIIFEVGKGRMMRARVPGYLLEAVD